MNTLIIIIIICLLIITKVILINICLSNKQKDKQKDNFSGWLKKTEYEKWKDDCDNL